MPIPLLLQDTPEITTLLQRGRGGQGKHLAAADRAACRWKAAAEYEMNLRLSQRPFGTAAVGEWKGGLQWD